jgi:nucleoside-diphosphate-sugar epimerase
VLLEACLAAGIGRVVHVSTDEVYGSIGEGSWAEGAGVSYRIQRFIVDFLVLFSGISLLYE